MGYEVWGVDAAVDEDGAVDVGVAGRGIDGGLDYALALTCPSFSYLSISPFCVSVTLPLVSFIYCEMSDSPP